jgi:hypothetical protein
VTFKDLKKRVSLETAQQQSRLFQMLLNKPFWNWNVEEHKKEGIKTNGNCCFNHIIGLPTKEGAEKAIFDYEQVIFESLVTQNGNKHLWIKKATGLGISDFMLRFMAWLCLKDNSLSGSQMCIVTGPRIDLAIALIDRMKKLFASSTKGIAAVFDSKETVIELNIDEADFFPPGQQQDARDVSDRYIAKSNPYIVMVTTPNAPDGLFERIEKESKDTCLYKRIFLDYTYGIGKIYTADAKQSPSFEREYNLKYLGRTGNVFHTKDIEGRKYNPDNFNPYYSSPSRSMGIDPAYGSSAFGIVVTEWADGLVQILYAEEYLDLIIMKCYLLYMI